MQMAFEDPAALKRRLRGELRRLRSAAGYTQKDVAEAMDWSPSKVIRIEAGSVAISTTDLRALLAHYGVTERDAIEELVDTAKGARKQTWGEFRDVVDQATAVFYGYEASASIIRAFQPQLIPGLLQTEEYTRALLRDAYEKSAKDIERIVEARTQRQELLDREEPPKLFYILDEAALRRQVGGPAVMRRQLDRVEELGSRPRISVQVLPFSLGAHPGMLGPFQMLDFPGPEDDPVLFLEAQGSQLTRDDPEEVGKYLDLFQGLEKRATPRSALSEVLASSKPSTTTADLREVADAAS